VYSGQALNALLGRIPSSGKAFAARPPILLDEDTLRHINVTPTTSRGNSGLLRNDGKLAWPLVLQARRFEKERKRLERNVQLAVAVLKARKPVAPATVKDIRADLETLTDRLSARAGALTPGQYNEAKRFLNLLTDAWWALADPGAVNYYNGTWVARGKSVAELVAHMKKEGLKFAPATPGDEASYQALYTALRDFASR
jgi:hypothetical protein